MVTRAILLVALTVFFLSQIACADEPILTGSTIKTEDATAKAADIFVGEFTDLGPTAPTSPGMAAFLRAKVKILKIFRGSMKAEITLEFDIFANNREALPQLEVPYLFFVTSNRDGCSAQKILPANDANIVLVKKLISN